MTKLATAFFNYLSVSDPDDRDRIEEDWGEHISFAEICDNKGEVLAAYNCFNMDVNSDDAYISLIMKFQDDTGILISSRENGGLAASLIFDNGNFACNEFRSHIFKVSPKMRSLKVVSDKIGDLIFENLSH